MKNIYLVHSKTDKHASNLRTYQKRKTQKKKIINPKQNSTFLIVD